MTPMIQAGDVLEILEKKKPNASFKVFGPNIVTTYLVLRAETVVIPLKKQVGEVFLKSL